MSWWDEGEIQEVELSSQPNGFTAVKVTWASKTGVLHVQEAIMSEEQMGEELRNATQATRNMVLTVATLMHSPSAAKDETEDTGMGWSS